MYFQYPLAAVLFAFSAASYASSQLIIFESGIGNRPGPTLSNGLIFCPSDFTKKGFNILCTCSEDAKFAKFYIDGIHVRTERAKPYFIAGDKNGRVKQWKEWTSFKGPNRLIKCEQSDGTIYEAMITLSCNADPEIQGPSASPSASSQPSVSSSSTPLPSQSMQSSVQVPSPSMSASSVPWTTPVEDSIGPATLLLHPAGQIGENFIQVRDGMTFCPDIFLFGEFTVQCMGSATSTNAKFFINGDKAKSESVEPYFIAGDGGGKAYSWHGYPIDEPFSIGCELSDGSASAMTMTVMCDENDPTSTDEDISGDGVTTSESGCVVIDAKASVLSDDWVETDTGVIFRPLVEGTYVAKAGKFPLSYQFIAPLTTQYAFVIDMTTAHTTEHNDVWAEFPAGGFQLMLGGVVNINKGQGWTKVYHNANGRSQVSTSVDFSPHSMATKEELVRDVSYDILLSGRSSKLEIHRIILFPCVDTGCQRGSSKWKSYLKQCKEL